MPHLLVRLPHYYRFREVVKKHPVFSVCQRSFLAGAVAREGPLKGKVSRETIFACLGGKEDFVLQPNSLDNFLNRKEG